MPEIRREHTETELVTRDREDGNIVTTNPATGQVLTVSPRGSTEEHHHEGYSGDPYAARRAQVERVRGGIELVFGSIEGLVVIRFLLRLLGANPAAGFAQFVYGVTTPLIAPFANLFPIPTFRNSALEWNSLVAAIVYALVGWVVLKGFTLGFAEMRSGTITRSTDIHTRSD